jgi:hypothetical protein
MRLSSRAGRPGQAEDRVLGIQLASHTWPARSTNSRAGCSRVRHENGFVLSRPQGLIQKGALACHIEIDARIFGLRLNTQHSALDAGLVNNQRKSVWQFWCTYTHSVLGWPAQHRSCRIS